MSKHLGDKLVDYAWETLTPQERAHADAHLRECADCRAELAGHQSLVSRLAAAIPAMLPAVPPRVSAGWPAVVTRVPRLRGTEVGRRSASGFIAIGLAMSTAALLAIAVIAPAWLGLGRPPLTATASYASFTPIASATYTPPLATPVGLLYATPIEAPRPLPARSTATAMP